MRGVYVGLLLAMAGTLSSSLGMNLFKASASFEGHLPWFRRTRYMMAFFLVIFLNTTLDGIAFTMTPLSLIAPLQGLTIALVVIFAAAGVGGHHEHVSTKQWQGIGVTIVGLVVCTWYGPTADAERALWPLISHYFSYPFLTYAVLSYAGCLLCILSTRFPELRCLVPPKTSVWWSVLTAFCAGMLAGLLQTQLKIFAQIMASIGAPAKVVCRGEYPGFCRYGLTSINQCPGWGEVMAFDWVCYGLFRVVGVEKLEAHPIHWLLHASSWGLIPTGFLQVNTMQIALDSNDMSLAMPLYSTSVLVGSIVAGSLYFDEANQMDSLLLFAVGAAITVGGLVVLAREKGRAEQLQKASEGSSGGPSLAPEEGLAEDKHALLSESSTPPS